MEKQVERVPNMALLMSLPTATLIEAAHAVCEMELYDDSWDGLVFSDEGLTINLGCVINERCVAWTEIEDWLHKN
jgi:hypothetical protein